MSATHKRLGPTPEVAFDEIWSGFGGAISHVVVTHGAAGAIQPRRAISRAPLMPTWRPCAELGVEPWHAIGGVRAAMNGGDWRAQCTIRLSARRGRPFEPRVVTAGETPSTRHMVAIGCMAWLAPTKRTPRRRRTGLLSERGRGFASISRSSRNTRISRRSRVSSRARSWSSRRCAALHRVQPA